MKIEHRNAINWTQTRGQAGIGLNNSKMTLDALGSVRENIFDNKDNEPGNAATK